MVEEDSQNLMRSDPSVLNVLAVTQYSQWVKSKKVNVFNRDAIRVTIPCDLWPFLHFSPNGGCSLAGGAGHPFGIWHAVFGTDRLKSML